MVMKRQADRFSRPPKLENARNVDAAAQAPVAGAPLTVTNGVWAPEQDVTTSYFFAVAAAPIPAGSPVTFTAVGIVAATTGTVHGIAALSATAGASIPVLRQGRLTLPGTLPENSLLYIDENGKITTTGSAKAYVIGFTKAANDARIFIGGAGGSGGGGSGGGGAADGVTITENPDGTLSVVNTAVPRANTTVRTQANGKISSDLLDTTNLFSGVQVRYLVPENTTWDREPEKHVVSTDLPNPVLGGKRFVLRSPFGSRPATAEILVKNKNGVWVRISRMRTASEYSGVAVSCNGDGNVYVSTGKYLFDDASGSVAPTGPGGNTRNEVVIVLSCQTTEVVATHIVGNRQYYLTAPGSSWDKGDPEDYIILPDMPTKVAGGATQFLKMVSPFGDKLVHTEVWLKFAGTWRRGEETYWNSNFNGVRSACPGDGHLYINIAPFPQHVDNATGPVNIPPGSTGTQGNTYKDYELCVIASVPEELNLPTISAKELAECITLDTAGWVAVPGMPATGEMIWVAPENGTLRLVKVSGSGYGAALKAEDTVASSKWQLVVNTTNAGQSAYMPVSTGESFRLTRTQATIAIEFRALRGCETKYALHSQTGGGQVNPEDAIRVGEIRNYSRYDSEIAENPSFLAIPIATEIDTASYPDFAALVGYTGRYPIPAADYCGAQSVPYIYLGKYTGDTLPEPLRSDISVGSGYDDARIAFVVDDDGLEISVPLVTMGAADAPLGSPALLFDVEGAAEPMEMRLRASDQLSATPDPMEILVKYAPRDK